MRKSFIASLLAVSVAAATGCQQMGITKETAGTVAGGLIGAALGSQIGGGNGKILATLAMAGVGAYIGNKIGSMLDERDQQALSAQTQMMLNESQYQTGHSEPVTWKSEHTDATAQLTKGDAYQTTKPVPVKKVTTIQSVSNMKLIQEPYMSLKSANVRSAPNTSAEKVGSLLPGTEFTAIGSTGDWILVGRKGVTVGYVHKPLVSPKAEALAKRVKPSVNLDEINVAANPETKAFDLDSLPTETATVATESTCRPISISVTAKGKTEQEQSTYCKQSNGTWELI